jgi:hypothetical protein
MGAKIMPDIERPSVPAKSRESSADEADKKLRRIMNGLAETVLSIPDEDLLAESRERGQDPMKEAEEVRKVLTDALRTAAKDGELIHENSSQ